MNLTTYYTIVQSVTTVRSIQLSPLCTSYAVKNSGNTVLVVRNETIQPGDFKSISGNFGEVTDDRIDISFGPQVTDLLNPPRNQGFVTQKVYRKGDGFDNLNF
jgi:hypothetical protein